MKLANGQQHNVQISYTEIHPNWTKDVEMEREIYLLSEVKYGFQCTNSYKTHSHSTALCGDLPHRISPNLIKKYGRY
jgi:hypothetical protein